MIRRLATIVAILTTDFVFFNSREFFSLLSSFMMMIIIIAVNIYARIRARICIASFIRVQKHIRHGVEYTRV